MLKTATVRTTIAAILAGLSISAHAMADSPRLVDIPAGDLRQALLTIAEQFGTDLVYSPEQIQGVQTHGAHGELTTEQAIMKLLEGTRLELRTDPSGAILIAPPATPQSLPSDKPPAQREPAQVSGLPEVLIKGARILNMDVKRSEDDAQPYYIFDSETLKQSGAVSVQDFLAHRVTMTRVQPGKLPSDGQLSIAGNATLFVGLLDTNTLILVNGRRLSGVSQGGTDSGPDLNGIPLAAIERIEVLPASASAIYGGKAETGVINIILKQNYQGGEVRYSFENTVSGSAPITTLNANYGLPLEGGRTQLTFAGHYSELKPLQLRDRGFIQRNIDQILANNSALLYTPTSPFGGATPNIGSSSNLVLKDGRTLGSRYTFVPEGTSSATSPTSLYSSLLANAGQVNTDLAPVAQGQAPFGDFTRLGITAREKSFMASVRREMSSRWEVFGEFSSSRDIGVEPSGFLAVLPALSIPATAPTNPFQQTVSIRIPNTFQAPSESDNRVVRAAGGVIVKLPWQWSAEADYTWSSNTTSSHLGRINTAAVAADAASGVLNPFVDVVAYPLDLSGYLGESTYRARTTLSDIGLRFAGPLWRLPGGSPMLVIGFEHRKEGYDDIDSALVFPSYPTASNDQLYLGKSQSVDSLYAEAQVPIVSAENGRFLLRQLDVQLAARTERYTVGTGTASIFLAGTPAQMASNPATLVSSESKVDSTNPTFGVRYRPVDNLMFRASYGTAFVPPSPSDLNVPLPATVLVTVNDPLRGNTPITPQTQLGGGNPDLQPERSKDWNVGLVFEAGESSHLRAAVDWFQIKKTDRFFTTGQQQIVNGVAAGQLPSDRVVRDPLSDADRALGYTAGPITAIYYNRLNLLKFLEEGFNLSLDYRLPTTRWGSFQLSALGTVIDHYKTQLGLNAPYADLVGWVTNGGVIKHRANATLMWEYRNWTLGWVTEYYDSYHVYGAPGDPTNPGTNLYLLAQGSDHVPSQVYHNISATYRFAGNDGSEAWYDRAIGGLSVQATIKNVFNTVPPLDVVGGSQFYYSAYGSARLRDYTISISKSF